LLAAGLVKEAEAHAGLMKRKHSVAEDAAAESLLDQHLQHHSRRAQQQEPKVHDDVAQEGSHCLQDSWDLLPAALGHSIQQLKSMRPGIESLDGRARLPEMQAELAVHWLP
jgi:uncharacterized protein YPO0396